MPTRDAMWEALGGQVDVLVVGGGITGTGIARDAVMRGLSVALVEQSDFAFGTSSRSSKLVHGGLRYLEQYEFSLVFEAVSERRILLDIAPHLVNPLGFLFPVYKTSRTPLWMVKSGMWLYEGLSLFRSPKRHRSLSPAEIAQEEPAMSLEGMTGAPLYYDCSTDDARLTLENALDAAKRGATVCSWTRCRSFLKNEMGRLEGAVVENVLTGELKEVRAHAVINATGPWTDRTVAMSKPLDGALLRPTKGVHIVVDADKLPVNNAIVCFHPTDGRVLFAIPWGEQTYIGTTDTDFEGDPAEVSATLEDVDYLLAAAGHYFPKHPLTHADVIATWAGLRPLMAPQSAGGEIDESAVSREHQIIVGQDGLITIAGGKLTTYRRMSAEVVETATKLLRLTNNLPTLRAAHTESEPLPGAVGWPEDDDHEAVANQVKGAGGGHVELPTARYLANTYGMRGIDIARRVAKDSSLGALLVPGRPEILAQVGWAVQEEMAASVADFMVRRTQLYYRDADQGLGCAEVVAKAMQAALKWTDEQRDASLQAYRDEVARSRQWRPC
ncbi:MAG: glycerol-3-phosphate dehydrogenase [Alphaproteobacteria bacterium]|nr:glycerol-3-phosphate dehydrogenase [Alphaproteobacteria bacterium]MCB9691683.1 glycerol-3-phosphate dehydrogenase [Alphaproteobacteria bacterium]